MDIILYDAELMDKCELIAAQKYFKCVKLRTEVPPESRVICRYPYPPKYRDLEQDIKNLKSTMLTDYRALSWIADFDYYEELKDFTFTSWFEKDFPYSGYQGPVVIKGRTNSKKQDWSKKMFAKDRKAAIEVASELAGDSFIGPQGLVYRQYIPLKTFEVDFNGLPYTNEFRLFYYKETLLSSGYYWSNAEHPEKGILTQEGLDLAQQVAKIAAKNTNFFVLDIAEKESGGWILVEINDGQCSGLSLANPDELYCNLAKVINNQTLLENEI